MGATDNILSQTAVTCLFLSHSTYLSSMIEGQYRKGPIVFANFQN